jgi:hypothetical protein
MWALLPHGGRTFCNRRESQIFTTGRFMQVLLASVSYFVIVEGMVIIRYDWLQIRAHVNW